MPRTGAVIAAALALPGLALAESAPEQTTIGFRYLYYKDYQPGLDRISVSSPSLYLLTPIGSNWSVEGSLVVDSVSGATPRWHSSISSASKMEDERTAGDLRITRYFRRAALGIGFAYSKEDDYESRAMSLDLRLATDDNNTTVAIGAGYSDDTITPNEQGSGLPPGTEEGKRVNDFMVGVTQVLTPFDIVQANLTYSRGRGYFSDQYKFNDTRPRERDQTALLLRWNHHFAGVNGTLRSSWRSYRDSFDVKAGTLGLEWAQPVARVLVTPSLRYHTQSAARFYVDPVPGDDFPPLASQDPPYYSADHRLSAFGAYTAGLKVAVPFGKSWLFDAKVDYYEQRGEWRIGGEGSPGLAPFKAQFYQVGLYYRY
ncbi:MAG: DUF3570 domain-containing protein [Burkholderiaceae bacterium]|nr:DUF3570 domain-containing protein [Burkholderiaceae bacterium]